MRTNPIGHTIFVTSEEYRMTNQKTDTIFFTSEKIRIGFSRLSGRPCEVTDVQLRQSTNGEEFLENSERQTKTRTGENPRDVRHIKPTETLNCFRFLEVKKIPLLLTNYTQRNDQQK